MLITLNDTLTETKPWRGLEPGYLNQIIANKLGYDWKTEEYIIRRTPNMDGVELVQAGPLWMVSNAYSHHQKITIAPHDIWYILLTEIASVIKGNVDACRPLFTRSPEKVTIMVQTDDVETINLDAVIQQLRGLVPVDMNVFLPEFTTDTLGAKYARNAAFCDAVQHYYNYMTFCCGIPAIKIAGTVEDWAKVDRQIREIGVMFSTLSVPGVSDWIDRVLRINDKITETLISGSADLDFWSDIYTHKNIGSGGELTINGWITDLYISKPTLPKLENFPYSWSLVPYENAETGRKFTGVHGCFLSKRDSEGFMCADYAEVVVEKIAKGGK